MRSKAVRRCRVAKAAVANEVIIAAALLDKTGFDVVHSFIAIVDRSLLQGFWIRVIETAVDVDSTVRRIVEEFFRIAIFVRPVPD